MESRDASKVTTEASYVGLSRPPMKWAIKHAFQIRDLKPETLQLAQQLGMEYVKFGPLPDFGVDQDAAPNHDPRIYKDAVRTVEDAGLKVPKIACRVHNRPEIVLNLPGRDYWIDQLKQHIRAVASVGIQYHLYAHMANGIWSTTRETNRGGASTRAFDEASTDYVAYGSRGKIILDREYSEEELWANWAYFARQIAPVAEECGVKLGVHPDDPPGLTLGNGRRPIFSSFDGYKRAIEIADSPNIGMGLCVGCWLEGGPRMGRNVLETIEYFGGINKLFVVHFRNVHHPLPHFRETYLNEGYMDMYKVMRALRKVNFEGVLVGDHFPKMVDSAGPLAAQIYTIGYIQALIERANEEGLQKGA
jgi:mannonate dehydratase